MVDKAGRKGKAKESANKIKALAYYEDYKSAGYTAKQLDLNRHTVERYFTDFAAKEINQTNEEFIARQHVVKKMVIEKMDEMIDIAQAQVDRFTGLLTEADTSPEGINIERLLQKSITDMTALQQQKAELEMTPTLDLHIAAEIEKKYAKFNEENSIVK